MNRRIVLPFIEAKPEPWKAEALCRGATDLFFPERGQDAQACKELCRRCPVQLPCAEAGLPEKFGVWGGLSERERRRVRRERGIRERGVVSESVEAS